ncbi:hypothetical protein R3W88_025121 [Solanum pinnatisectum]|uniref:Alpha/beta hydrolase fold-3 domain-containing protein n=1 Tax=Solanum pinnatisectum TaxID=50273 RepID=A0AAV9M2Y0_9SOLN|nr:hypothetical protein R3W88_025121 [Solanum pinnatisectum]
MDSINPVVYDIPKLFKIYKDGSVENMILFLLPIIQSQVFHRKDIVLVPENNVMADGELRSSALFFISTQTEYIFHPYFGSNWPDPIWAYCCPENPKTDDPRFNPAVHLSLLSKLVCSKILICVGEKDFIRDRGWSYYEALKKYGWKGEVEIKETQALIKWLADFFQQSS